jgi:hypothetical protein
LPPLLDNDIVFCKFGELRISNLFMTSYSSLP